MHIYDKIAVFERGRHDPAIALRTGVGATELRRGGPTEASS